ncbi:hypothetical protein ACFO25_04935 [Paenactinomyces guangxiensis]|uniref:Uncharacterized protein n=1 Tax=Paenactinomyces guangxiensis TaxID=1490290 RepID=A0A7W1WPV3_9BACL|nr:hypothetical protein [Paenactinomyces guangxiensis]MBA4493723.1 hypothetical protein [Paenactinomyces guangxiensis]MBH8591011.1 hypothetical protein [Paenactinomyces guangxiensis]
MAFKVNRLVWINNQIDSLDPIFANMKLWLGLGSRRRPGSRHADTTGPGLLPLLTERSLVRIFHHPAGLKYPPVVTFTNLMIRGVLCDRTADLILYSFSNRTNVAS